MAPVLAGFGAGLSFEEQKQLLFYKLVKAAVLRAYELMPEAYRQRFRSDKKEKRSHTEFARELATHFNRWCAASQVKTFEDLQELILLEQFKNTLPDHVVTYINEQKVSKVTDAAKLADEFVLTHKVFFGENHGPRFFRMMWRV
uniref:SCAN box domain-containing protein n=1 Tax=Sander lucioperca TaxID=283035 RepID=A0A8C9X7J6_SANLU